MERVCTVNFAYNDTRRGVKKVSLFAKCRYTQSLIICSTVGRSVASGHGNPAVIRELFLYPQPLLAKMTVCHVFLVFISLTLLPTDALAHCRSHPWGTYQLVFLLLLLLPQLNNLDLSE